MFNIRVLNSISNKGLSLFPKKTYALSEAPSEPDALLLRSYALNQAELPESLLVVGRAGAGVNNIPVAACTDLGIPVLNTPGANANAVKELVLAGMLIASRHICQSWDYAKTEKTSAQFEAEKSRFIGSELQGKTLGLVGLGNIGVQVANAASALGMNVLGFDPHITPEHAWKISSLVARANSLTEVMATADYISIHIPLNDNTRGIINAEVLAKLKQDAILLNFARAELIDESALAEVLSSNKLKAYISDFPNSTLQQYPQVLCLPHIGASTIQAQENCAIMVTKQIMDYLENGNITHSVNFPDMSMPKTPGTRLTIVNKNIPSMLAQISTSLSDANLNILDMMNRSKGDIAYTLVDVDGTVNTQIVNSLNHIEGIVKVRVIPKGTL